jgi:hypothetical protein
VGVASMKGTGRPAIEHRNQAFRASTLLCQGEDNMRAAALAWRYIRLRLQAIRLRLIQRGMIPSKILAVGYVVLCRGG